MLFLRCLHPLCLPRLMSDDNIMKLLFKQDVSFGSVAEKLDAPAIVACEFAADTSFLQLVNTLLYSLGISCYMFLIRNTV